MIKWSACKRWGHRPKVEACAWILGAQQQGQPKGKANKAYALGFLTNFILPLRFKNKNAKTMYKAIKSIQSVHKVICLKWMQHGKATIRFLFNFLSIFWLNFMFLIGTCREQIWKALFLPLFLSWNFWLNCEDLILSEISN